MEKRTLGEFVALLRKEKGLTQKQLAELLNVSDKTVSHWECDENSPDISLLPLLAQILGVTVDELLQGERKEAQPTADYQYTPPKSEGFAARTINKIKSRMSGDITERYRYFRILSLVGTVIALVVLLSVTLTNIVSGTFLGYYVAGNMLFLPGIIVFLGSLWTLAISLGFTLGARLAFSKGMLPCPEAGEDERRYIYKANSVSFNNIFLLLCSLPLSLTGIDELGISVFGNIVIVLVFLAAAWLVLVAFLNKKGILRTDRKKSLMLRYISIFTLTAILFSGSLLFIREAWYPAPKNIIFDNAAEFIAYMETPESKPYNAYIIEGVTATVHPSTMPAPATTSPYDSPVRQPPSENLEEEIREIVLGQCGDELVSFKWLNEAVYDFTYNEEEGTFHVITFEAKIKQKDLRLLVDDGVPVAVVMLCVADAVACFCLYKKKEKQITVGQ